MKKYKIKSERIKNCRMIYFKKQIKFFADQKFEIYLLLILTITGNFFWIHLKENAVF